MTSNLISILKDVVPFSNEELDIMECFLVPVTLKKNEILLDEGQHCNTLFLVDTGILRNYYNNNASDQNLAFTLESQFCTSFEAYLNKEPSKIIIESLENSFVWKIDTRGLVRANSSNPNFSTFVRRLAIRILFATEEHYNMMMMNSPADRYRYIVENRPELLQRISLSHLASYIGITRETLSRIRSNKY